MATKNWTSLFKDYKGLWVALKDDEVTVISSGNKLPEVLRQAMDKGFDKPIITKIPEKDVTYIGSL
jgi:hypothetical protein